MPSHFGGSKKSSSTGNSARESYRTSSSYQSSGKKASAITERQSIKKEMTDFANYSYQPPKTFSPTVNLIAGLVGEKGFNVNKDYYTKNVIGKTNPLTGKAYSGSITDFQSYMRGRGSGTLDAMGRTILSGGNDRNQNVTTQTQQQTAQTPTPVETEEDIKKKRTTILGSGYGQRTMLTSASGDESEANVSKTILGGTVRKRI